VKTGLVGPGPDLGIAGFDWFDLLVAGLDFAASASAAGSVGLILAQRLPDAGILWRYKEKQLKEPEPDYSEGA